MALIVGIDLGRKSAHDAVILKRETGLETGRGFRDLSGNPISKAEAKAIITATWGDVDYSKKGLATA